MADQLTRTNLMVLSAIREHFRTSGHSPSLRDLADRLHLGPSTIHHHVGRLTAAGAIRVRSNRTRGIELVDTAASADVAAELAGLRAAFATTRVNRQGKGGDPDAYAQACLSWDRRHPASARFITDHVPVTAGANN